MVAEPLVGKRLATVLGPGLVESVRTSDAVVVVRLEWGAMAYLQRDAIIYGGDHVSTGFGQGEVVSVQVIPRPHEDLKGLGEWLQ